MTEKQGEWVVIFLGGIYGVALVDLVIRHVFK